MCMDRNIAIVTHELRSIELDSLEKGLERYHCMMRSMGLYTNSTVIGELSDLTQKIGTLGNIPNINPDGSMNFQNLTGVSLNIKVNIGDDSADRFKNYSDFMLVVNRRIIDPLTEEQHVKNRAGEAYGGSPPEVSQTGNYCFVGLNPLELLDSEIVRNKYLDYIIRHELGHSIGGLKHPPNCIIDNVMNPVPSAMAHELLKKSVDYSPDQWCLIELAVNETNVKSIKKLQSESKPMQLKFEF